MPVTGAIVDVATARTYLKRDASDDAQITLMIDYATGAIERHCARRLRSRTYSGGTTLLHDGSGTARLRIKEYPVTAFAAARLRAKDGVTATRVLDTTGYEIERGRVLYSVKEGWPCGTQNIEVDCTAGIVDGSPDLAALQHWCLRWVQVMFQDHLNGFNRGLTVTAGGVTTSVPDVPMPKDVEHGLKPFVRLV